MLKEIKSGIIISITFLLFTGIIGFSYASLISLKVNPSTTLDDNLWNNLVDHSVPSGAINAFYLASCPTGWKAADGTNFTPDLRGQFLRGLNDFGTGLRSDGNQNPDTKALGEYQSDTIQNITGEFQVQNAAPGYYYDGAFLAGTTVSQYGGGNYQLSNWQRVKFDASNIVNTSTETRSKNISVIFCIKE